MHKLHESILAYNREQSNLFTSRTAASARQMYRLRYQTEIVVLKCMDGRLNLTLMTETPPGIIKPFRNIGGRFDLGWPSFGQEIREVVGRAAAARRDVAIFLTYHFSKGDTHRGCAGFHYDTAAARASAELLRAQFNRVFGSGHQSVYPLVVAIETDEDTLTFHGANGQSVSMNDPALTTPAAIESALKQLYPDMPSRMLRDVAMLAQGNRKHIEAIRKAGREPIEREHREQVIGIGTGFDWMHIPNTILIVGPYSHDWPDAVATAGKIILGNIDAGRADAADGVLLFGSAFSHDKKGTAGWNLAAESVEYVTHVAKQVLADKVPEVAEMLSVLKGVVDGATWHLDELPAAGNTSHADPPVRSRGVEMASASR